MRPSENRHDAAQAIIAFGVSILALAITGCGSGAALDPADGGTSNPGTQVDLSTSPNPGTQTDQGVPAPTDLASIPNQFDLGPLSCNGNETFMAAQQAMLSSCSGFGPMSCHMRAPFAGGLDLTMAHAYASLVNVPANGAPGKVRVRPSDPDNSFLVEKLTNTMGPNEGDPMPKGEAITWRPPAPDKLNILRCWISRGAPND
jgi:hypothetical protein